MTMRYASHAAEILPALRRLRVVRAEIIGPLAMFYSMTWPALVVGAAWWLNRLSGPAVAVAVVWRRRKRGAVWWVVESVHDCPIEARMDAGGVLVLTLPDDEVLRLDATRPGTGMDAVVHEIPETTPALELESLHSPEPWHRWRWVTLAGDLGPRPKRPKPPKPPVPPSRA